MAYTFLDNSLNTIGVLTNKGGQTNDYWGDSITHEIATSQDVLTSVSLSVDKPSVNIDTSGNQKTWNHVIQGLSFNIDGIGRKVNENDYLIYQEGTNGKYYLMAITQVDESAVQSGFHYKTVQGLNAAAYDLSRKTLRAKSFAQIPDNTQEKGTAQNILRYIFKDINWDVRIIGSFGAIDYEITEGTTAQAVLLDIIGMFEAEVDAYVQLNNWGKGANVFNKNGSVKRIFDFSTSLGKYRGETIRYDKNMVSITKTGARDSMYTKLYVNGNNITIADVNHGADFIVDDVANRKYNKLGSVSTPVTYLEGIITNSAIESPTALLTWGKKQLKILNHPRYNYQISATNDDKVQLGDTVIIQDTHASDPIYLKSKVISKTVSLADPVNNSFIVGEFSPIVIGADNGLDDTDQIMQLVNQANQTAVNAQKQADENTKKIADTRTDLEKNIDDRISEAKSYSDELTQTVAKQVNSELAIVKSESDNLSAKTDQMIADANSYADTMYNNAVSFAKTEASKALSDANTALDEAKSDLTDGIASEASERQQAVAIVNSQAQDYASQAKSDALNAITKEVSDREKAVSALDTKATNAVNQAKSDITDTINALSVGDRNYILDTTNPKTQTSNGKDNQDMYDKANFYSPINNWGVSAGSYIVSFDWSLGSPLGSDMTGKVIFNKSPYQNMEYVIPSNTLSGHISLSFSLWSSTQVSGATGLAFRIMSQMASGNTITYSNLFMKSGTINTTWTPAPEDIVLDYTTKDNEIKETITQYKDTNDGKVTKAQTDATTALGLVATKVSQTDYNTKTGDLDSKYTAVKQTVDSQATDIVNIKATATSQASKINSISSDVDGTKQSISDIETTQDSQSDKINQITSDVNGTKQSITDIQTKDGKQDTRMGNIETSVSGIKSDFSTYKTTNDGAVKTAQTTAQTAVDGLKTKVSQTDYNTKTGKLQTDLTETSQTANQAKSDIVAIKSEADSQSAQINDIVSDAKGTTQTISDIQTEQGKQSGSIATLQSRADGFDATVTKVNNLSVGGRNLYLDSKVVEDKYGTNADMAVTIDPFDSTTNMWHIIAAQGQGGYIGIYLYDYGNGKIPNNSDWSYSVDIKGRGKPRVLGIEHGEKNPIEGTIGSTWSRISQTGYMDKTDHKTVVMYFDTTDSPLDVYIKLPKLETGNTPTAWSPAPEDLSGATAKAQLTADKANLDLSTYKTDADGRISKAQSDITATSKEVKTKVSQTDFDETTGDLSGKYTVQQQTINGISNTVTELQASVNSLGQVNQLMNTEFSPDFAGWYTKYPNPLPSDTVTTELTKVGTDGWGSNVVSHKGGGVWLSSGPIAITQGTPVSISARVSVPKAVTTGTPLALYVMAFDSSGNRILSQGYNIPTNQLTSTPTTFKYENKVMPSNASQVYYLLGWNVNDEVYISQPMLVFSDHIGDYVQGNYNNNAALAQVKITADSVSSIVSDPKTGLSTRVQTAEGTLSKVKGIDIPNLQKATFWQPYSSLNFNDYTKQGSFFFNTTSAKTNGPTTSNSWTYLIVEQGTADNNRIKQTAWYDGVNGVKITYVRTRNDSTWSPWYANDNDSVTTISQTNDSIKREITDRKTGDNNTLESSKNFTTSSITKYNEGIQSQFTQTASGILAQVESTNMVVNSEFDPLNGTWYALSNGGSTGSQLAEAWNAPQAHSFEDWSVINGSRIISYVSATWYTSALVTASAGKVFSASIVAGRAPAPTVSTALDFRIGFWDSSRKLLTTASAGNIIDGTVYKGAQKYVVENKTAPANTAFVSVIIAHSSANATDFITRPSLNTGAKASPYTPTYGTSSSSTILSLFKDNWSIGINDNSGKLISGINGDTSGTVIQGKKLVINPDTTFNGLNFMNGAMIKDASISQAKIGNLQVSSAQITSLDVSKLTGDTANFVTANIKSLNANKLYGDTGYLGTVSAGRIINNQDHHLQLAAHGLYNEKTHRAQVELLDYGDPAIGSDMKGSFNYYSGVGDEAFGIRLWRNHILAIDSYKNGAGNLYLSAYDRGEVRIVNRPGDQYAPIAASRFRVASQRALKSNITDLKDGALDIVNSVKIHKYTKSGESEIGVITDEVPDILKSDGNRTISLYDYTSVLYKAVQELSQQVKELQDERTTLQ